MPDQSIMKSPHPDLSPAGRGEKVLLAADLAGDPVPWRNFFQDLLVLRAARHADGTARVEAAAGRRLDGAGDVALEEDALALHRRVGDGHRGEKRLRVGMLRVVVELLARGDLHDLAQVHHGYARGDVLDHGEIVSDEEVRQVELLLEILQEID